jgi:hypothetical protein
MGIHHHTHWSQTMAKLACEGGPYPGAEEFVRQHLAWWRDMVADGQDQDTTFTECVVARLGDYYDRELRTREAAAVRYWAGMLS